MKIVKSLILTLILAGTTFAGDMWQFGAVPISKPPSSSSQKPADIAATKILVIIMQSLLSLR
jgi:hypothetical protein